MRIQQIDRLLAITITLLFFAGMTWVALAANGTGDDGDGIQHYLFARYAFNHPENFLNHWAKPLFVMLTAPFAQFGFTGFKIFNTALLCGAMYLGFVAAQRLEVRHPWMATLFVALSPMCMTHVQTGLTEPLFALWLMVGVCWFIPTPSNVQRSLSTALPVVWLSFLPFIRSEGLVVLCVIAVWLFVIRRWQLLPLLMVGHIVMGLIGWAHHGTPMWVFTKIPYQSLDNGIYGSGPWLHYYKNMPELLDKWLFVFWRVGVVAGLIRMVLYWVKPAQYPFKKAELWLVYGISTGLFVAHTLFWALGIFNSYGLMRVFIGVMPLFGIIMAQGINFVVSFVDRFNIKWLGTAIVAFLTIGATVHTVRHLHWGKFVAYGDMKDQLELGKQYAERYKGYTFYFDAMVPALAFDVDLYDPKQYRKTRQLLTGDPIPEKSVVVWDFRYSGWEAQVSLDTLLKSGRFTAVTCQEGEFNGALIRKTCILEYLPPGTGKRNELYTNDLEKIPAPEANTNRASSGRQSIRLRRDRAFSPVWSASLSSLEAAGALKIRYSFKAWAEAFPTEGYKAAKLVIEITSEGKQAEWTGTSVQPLMTSVGQWQEVAVEYPLPKKRHPDDTINIYLWNENDDPIWIDDLKVEMVQ
jgi:hypothetical protein